jgi:mRNA interferase HigB
LRVIARRSLRTFWEEHPDAEGPLRAWCKEVERSDWTTPAQVKDRFPRASIVRDNRVVFDIGGNRFRLVAWVNYRQRAVYIKWLGTHSEYDRIDVETVGL